jgi:hypothetical protein
MSKTNALHVNGILPIVPTPFTIEELIDWASLQRLVNFACATGACAMCLPAYASEFSKLSESDRLQLVAEAVRQAAGRPMMSSKVVAILEAPSGQVGVLENWGGMYILDLMPAGICGELDRHTEDRIAFLNGRILALLDQLDLPRHPNLLPSHEGVLEA